MGFINNFGYEVKIGSSSEEIYILKWLGCYDPICIAAFTDIFVHLNTGGYKLFEWFAMVYIICIKLICGMRIFIIGGG